MRSSPWEMAVPDLALQDTQAGTPNDSVRSSREMARSSFRQGTVSNAMRSTPGCPAIACTMVELSDADYVASAEMSDEKFPTDQHRHCASTLNLSIGLGCCLTRRALL